MTEVSVVQARTKLVMSFEINVEVSKGLACSFSLSRNSGRRENELQEFAKLVEAQFKRETAKLKFHFSKIRFLLVNLHSQESKA